MFFVCFRAKWILNISVGVLITCNIWGLRDLSLLSTAIQFGMNTNKTLVSYRNILTYMKCMEKQLFMITLSMGMQLKCIFCLFVLFVFVLDQYIHKNSHLSLGFTCNHNGTRLAWYSLTCSVCNTLWAMGNFGTHLSSGCHITFDSNILQLKF